jgi:hypothetical protein
MRAKFARIGKLEEDSRTVLTSYIAEAYRARFTSFEGTPGAADPGIDGSQKNWYYNKT